MTARSLIEKSLASAALVVVVAGTACDPTDPTGLAGDEPVDVSGTWQFQRSFSTEFGATQITAVLELHQEGSQITGTSRNGTYKSSLCGGFGTCAANFEDVAPGSVSGTVSGNRVVLEFNADNLGEIDRFEGTMVNGSIEGDDWTATPGIDTDTGGDQPAQPPAAPTSLQAAVVQTAEGPAVDLSWQDNSNDEDGFLVAESCDGAEWDTIGGTDPNATGVRVPGPFPGTECSYAVAAYRGPGEDALVSDPSNVATVTIP